MGEEPQSQYVEIRDGGYFVSGTRIGLDVIVHQFESGKSPEAILQSYPAIGSLAKTYGAITFILEHPEVVQRYLEDQDRLWEQVKSNNALSADMLERFHRARELSRKSG
jgi:uncharacterized protein (DUF433 family)